MAGRKLRGSILARRQRVSLGVESLEGRLLLNTHPAGEVPHHIHPHLAIFIDGQNFTVPVCIGTNFGVSNGRAGCTQIGPTNENAHTHTDDGILHYNEATPGFRNLKEFFDTWGAVFNANEIKLPITGQPGQFVDKTADDTHTIKFFVNGAASGDFENYEPEDGDQIVISYESIPSDLATPTLDPINNVTMLSNFRLGAPARTIQVPLNGSDPIGSPLTYTVTVSPSDSPLTAQVIASSNPATDNPSLRLNVSGKDIDRNDFTGDVVFQLFQDLAPNTVNRITTLVNQGFYDGLTFHRIENDFAAQGGDPNGGGTAGSGTQFDDEFTSQLTFTGFGQLAMANSGPDTNDSQFFVTDSNLNLLESVSAVGASPSESPPQRLNFRRTIFGQLTRGFTTFNKIMLTPVHASPVTGDVSVPDNTVHINSATIFNDDQHAVLRLSAPAGFTDEATVTVTASNEAGLTDERSFEVEGFVDRVNDRPFLGHLDDLSTTVNQSITLTIPATDLELDRLTFVVRDPANFSRVPRPVRVAINQAAHRLRLTPARNFTGTIDLLIGVRDQTPRARSPAGRLRPLNDQANFDTQWITLTVNAASVSSAAVLARPVAHEPIPSASAKTRATSNPDHDAPLLETNVHTARCADADRGHDAEHGRAGIRHEPTVRSAPGRGRLELLARKVRASRGIVSAPLAAGPDAIALGSWADLQALSALDIAAITDFILAHRGRGPARSITP